MNLNTKIKNIFRAGKAKKWFAVASLAAVLFSFVSFLNVGSTTQIVYAASKCSTSGPANDTVELCANIALDTEHKDSNNNPLYKFTSTVTHTTDPSCQNCNANVDDITKDYQFAWTLTKPFITFGNKPGVFYDSLTALQPGNTYTFNDTAINGSSQLTVDTGITIGSGATSGLDVTVVSATPTGTKDATGNANYNLIAQLADATGNVKSGGVEGVDTKAPIQYSWSWSATISAGPNKGNTFPLAKKDGFNIIDAFPVGSYYLTATATPTNGNGSPIHNNLTTNKAAQLNVGDSNGNQLDIITGDHKGFEYNLIATINSTPGVAAVKGGAETTDPKQYKWNWTIDGGAVQSLPYNPTVTLQKGDNLIKIEVDFPNNGGSIQNEKTFTLDDSGNITATNRNTSVPTDICSISTAGILCIVGKVIGAMLGFFVDIIAWLTAHLLLPITENVINIQVHTAAFAAVIIQEWVFIRNLCNIFFIATLIMLGITTLVQVGNYDPKKVLPKLVISALLINFSLAIAQAILGVADVLQAQFLGANADQAKIILENLAYRLMTAPLAHITAAAAQTGTGLSVALVTEVVYFLVAIVAMFVFIALTAYLIVRIVAVWLLLMTSPIAFATSFVPSDAIAGLGKKWWDYFIKYAFFTPIIALLIHICALLANAQATFTAGSIANQFANQAGNGTGSLQTFATDILTSFLVAACLGAALKVADSMGIAGAKQINGAFNKAKDKVFGAPVAGGKWAATYAGKRGMREIRNASAGLVNDKDGNIRTGWQGLAGRSLNAMLNPDAVAASWKHSFDSKNKNAQEYAQQRSDKLQFRNQTGTILNRFGANNGVDNKADLHYLQKQNDEKKDKLMSLSRTELQNAYNDAKDPKTRANILAIRNEKGYLKRDIVQDGEDDANSDQIAAYMRNSMQAMPDDVKKTFAHTMNKIAEKTKDLSVVGLDQSEALSEQMKIDIINAASGDDIGKFKPSFGSKAVAQAWVNRMKGSSESADSVTPKQMEALEKISGDTDDSLINAIVLAQSPERVLKYGKKMLEDKDGKTHKVLRNAVKARALDDSSIANKFTKEQLQSYTNIDDRAALIDQMNVDTIIKLDQTVYRDNTTGEFSKAALNSLVEKLNKNAPKAKELSNDLLQEVTKPEYDFGLTPELKNQISERIGAPIKKGIPSPSARLDEIRDGGK